MQSGKQFERLQREAIYKLRSKFHAQTLANECSRRIEQSSLRRPDIFKLSRQLLQLRDEHRRDRFTGEAHKRTAVKLLESFPTYSVDEDPQFICSLRILRAVAYFRGSLLEHPPASVRWAVQHHTAHTFLWDAPAAVGFVSVLPSLSNTIAVNSYDATTLDDDFGHNLIGTSGLIPNLTNTMRVIAPRVYQLTPQFTPTEALAIVAAYGTVDASVATAEQSNVSLLGTINPLAVGGLALEDFAPSPPIDYEAPDVNASASMPSSSTSLNDGAAASSSGTSAPSSPTSSSSLSLSSKSLVNALSTVSLMCDDHKDTSEMCRFVYYSAALSAPVGAAHLLCLQPKLLELINTLAIDDIVSLCRCVSRTKRVSRRLMMAVGRRALLLLGDMTPSAIGDVLNAFQMANLRHLPLIKRCATRQLMLLEAQTPQSAAHTLGAMAHFGVYDTLTFAALGRRVHRMEMEGTVYASLLHSCATAGIGVPHLVTEELLLWFSNTARLREEELTSNIAIVAWSLTKLMDSTAAGQEGMAGTVSGRVVLTLLEELMARFTANPAMARAKGASEGRIMRQTMSLDACAAIIKMIEGAGSSAGGGEGMLRCENAAVRQDLSKVAHALMQFLAQ